MKANQVIEKMVQIRDNNSLNAEQEKYVKQVIEDFSEFGEMFEEDEDAMKQVKQFIAKFPDKPKFQSPSRVKSDMEKAKAKLREKNEKNFPKFDQASLRLNLTNYTRPQKKSVELEGIILDTGDEVHDKSTGKTIIVEGFETRPEGIYILGTTDIGERVDVLRENASVKEKSSKKSGTGAKKSKAEKEAQEANAAAAQAKKAQDEKTIKKGTYLDLGKDIIRVGTFEKTAKGLKVTGKTRTGKDVEKTISEKSAKVVDFSAFKFQESEGKAVVEISDEVRILNAFLELQSKSSKNGAENLMNRINQFTAEYVAEHGKGKNPFRQEINAISDSLIAYLSGQKAKIWVSKEDLYTQIVEKSESERLYETVRVVKYFSTWAKRTVTQDNIKELENRIDLARKRKDIKTSDPLYSDVVEVEKILVSMKNGGSYTFPDLGLGDVSQGLAGTRKMIHNWGKDAENRAKAVMKKSQSKSRSHSKPKPEPKKEEKKSFFQRLFS